MNRFLRFLLVAILFILLLIATFLYLSKALMALGISGETAKTLDAVVKIILSLATLSSTIISFFEKRKESVVDTPPTKYEPPAVSYYPPPAKVDEVSNPYITKIADFIKSNYSLPNGISIELDDQINKKIETYLKYICDEYSKTEIAGIQRGTTQILRLNLEEIYYPLRAEMYQHPISDPNRHPITISLDKVLSSWRNIVLSGGPGCGKTTVIRYIAHIISKAILENDQELAREKLGIDTKFLPIPIILPISDFSKLLQKSYNDPNPIHGTIPFIIYSYLVKNYIDFGIPLNTISLLLESKFIILLLDGIDEIPDEDLRETISGDIEQFCKLHRDLHVVVTCRSSALKGTDYFKQEFREIRIKQTTIEDAKQIVKLAYGIIYENNPKYRDERIEDLVLGIENLEENRRSRTTSIRELVNSPLIVNLLILIHYSNSRLPEQRARLYMEATDYLLFPKNTLNKEQGKVIEKSVGGSWLIHRDILQHLAFHMHTNELKEIKVSDVRRFLIEEANFAAEAVDEMIKLVSSRTTVMEERNDYFQFLHLGFQEYLTARYLAEVKIGESGMEGVVSFLEKNYVLKSWWREPILLLVGYLSSANSPTMAGKFIKRFAGLETFEDVKNNMSSDLQLAALEVSIASLLEWPEATNNVRDALDRRLSRLLRNPKTMNSTSQHIRADFGRAIGRIGDPRFDSKHFYLPKGPTSGFVKINEGSFTMGANQKVDLEAWADEIPQREVHVDNFYISKYQTTVDQFRQFVNDDKYIPKDLVGIHEKIGNHPVSYVTWFDCINYCKWLTNKLHMIADEMFDQSNSREDKLFWEGVAQGNLIARLPTEMEWEKAARGTDARIYPWGNKLETGNANFGGEASRSIVAVGLYPAGVNSYGLWDMSGNVWEWTLSPFNLHPSYDENTDQQKAIKESEKVMRGGSFYFNSSRGRCTTRYKGFPNVGIHDCGFRVAIGARLTIYNE